MKRAALGLALLWRVSAPAWADLNAGPAPNTVIPTGADPTGVADSTAAINAALVTPVNGVFPSVNLLSGNYKISNALTLQGGQCLYGDGDHSTFLQIGAGFSPSATGVIVLSGQETASPCLHDFGFAFAVPPGLTTTTSAAQASGTTIQVNASIPVNYYVDDTTTPSAIPALTYVTNVAGTGPYTLTLSATVTGVLNGDTIKANPTRNSFAPLGTCTTGSGGTGCQYPPAVYGVAGNRPRIWNIYVGGAWAGFDFTGGGVVNIVPWIENISMGALNYGLRMDGAQDFSHIAHWHNWNFGLNGNGDSNVAYQDGQTIAWQIGRADGLNVSDATFWTARLIITSNASNSTTPSQYTNIMLDGNGSNLEISGGYSNSIVNLYKTGLTLDSSCPINVSSGYTQISDSYLVTAAGTTTSEVCVSGGTLNLIGGYLNHNVAGQSAIQQTGGSLKSLDVSFGLAATQTAAAINATAGSGIVILNNTAFPGTSGTAVNIGYDTTANIVLNNRFKNYSLTFPSSPVGFYGVPFLTDSGGAVNVAANSTMFNGTGAVTSNGSWNATRFNPTGATIPGTSGIYAPAANTLGFGTNGASSGLVDSTQHFRLGPATSASISSGACGAGSNGTLTAQSNDQGGGITIGASATASCSVTFAGAYINAPRQVQLTPANPAADSALTGTYVSSLSTSGFTITGTLANTNWYYFVQ